MGETLAEHTWAVLCRVADLARLRPGLPQFLGLPRLWHLLFWAAFLHDWGKVASGFQSALRGRSRWDHRHEVLSLAFLDWFGAAFEGEEATWVAAGVGMHHKNMSELQSLYPAGLAPEDDPIGDLVKELHREDAEGLWRWGAHVVAAWVDQLGLDSVGIRIPELPSVGDAVSQTLAARAARIRHWMQQSYRLVRDMENGGDRHLRIWMLLLRGYLIQSDYTASAHQETLVPPEFRPGRILGASHISPGALYGHQEEAGQVVGSCLLIAPTGSGKTESALLWAARQWQVRGAVPRVFYTLPYQASMNAMYDRLQKVFPGQVGLLHGRSALALYRRFMDQGYAPDEATRLARALRNWAGIHVPPVRVFSPYHMLKAAYQLKGYEAMLADYAQAAFIFDEIHAYEPARLAMILETMRFLRENLGASFFVMTATMPTPVRRHVEEALGSFSAICAPPEVFRAFTRHRLYLVAGNLLGDSGLDAIANAFREGQSVLVTFNTVARAQEAYRALKARIPEAPPEQVILIHGRFNGRDRLAKERAITNAVSVGRVGRNPVLVISTQVVEVSLNIDLDTIFTDPAPLEALVQRFGRVNRKRRLASAPVHVFTEPADGQGVYDPRLVQGALRVLGAHKQGSPIDEGAIQGWLDIVYQDEVLEDWEREYHRVSREFRAAFLDRLRPFSADSGIEDAFNRLFDGLEVLPVSLRAEYARLREERPLEAAELLVPIGWRRWLGLKGEKRVLTPPNEWPPVIDAQYSSETGLEFAK